MNAAELLCAGRADAIALIEGDTRLDYAALRALCIRNAAAWIDAGIVAGQRCVISLADSIDWAGAFLGLIWAGAQPISVNPRTSDAQLRELVEDSGAVALLLDDARAASLGDARAIGLTAWRQRTAAATHAPAAVDMDEDAPAFLLYSSGTTGKPKGVIHAQRAVKHAHVFARDILGAGAEDRFYSSSKLFFAYPLANSFFAGLRLGATVILDPAWPDPQQVAATVEKHRPSIFFSVPTLYRRLLDAGTAFPALRAAVSAGEACPPALAEEWAAHTGVELVNGYGTTETLSLMLYRTQAMPALCASPLTNVVEEDIPGSEGSRLRLWFSHPAIALGYSREVTHDTARFGNGTFSPGDVFRPAESSEGWQFAGRTDQLVKVFGRWVDVLAVENALHERLKSQVNELCVVPSQADDADVIRLHLFAVPGSTPENELLRTAREAIEALPPYQRPESVHLVEDFPRTDTGKLRRGELAKSLPN